MNVKPTRFSICSETKTTALIKNVLVGHFRDKVQLKQIFMFQD